MIASTEYKSWMFGVLHQTRRDIGLATWPHRMSCRKWGDQKRSFHWLVTHKPCVCVLAYLVNGRAVQSWYQLVVVLEPIAAYIGTSEPSYQLDDCWQQQASLIRQWRQWEWCFDQANHGYNCFSTCFPVPFPLLPRRISPVVVETEHESLSLPCSAYSNSVQICA